MEFFCVLRRLLDIQPLFNDSIVSHDLAGGRFALDGDTAAAATCPIEHADSLSYLDFVERYMAPNRPVLIKGACHGWKAFSKWATADGAVNMQALEQMAGHCQVAVTDTARCFNGFGPCTTMTLAQYAGWWRQRHLQNQQQDGDQLRHNSSVSQQRCQLFEDGHAGSTQQQQHGQPPLLYLKDFHYVGNFPEDEVYTTPTYFTEDWLNEYYDHKQQQQQQQQHRCNAECSSSPVTSDYRFVYCGPAGSWTPVHSDVLRSYSWSANVAGRKRWWLLPPQYTYLLEDRHGQLPTDFFNLSDWPFKHNAKLEHQPQRDGQQLKYAHQQYLVELVQEVGDVLFVPSGWHHMVVNEADTLSINHNWINAHNVHWSWALLHHEYQQATELLEDCRDTASPDEFEQLVQNMLAANSGFNLQDFAAFLTFIISRRLAAMQQLKQQLANKHKLNAGSCIVLVDQPLQRVCHADVSLRGADEPCGGVQRQENASQPLQLQLLQCALDLARASTVLQQVQDAYVAAVARSVAWCEKHSKQQQHAGCMAGARSSETSSSHINASCGLDKQLQRPDWAAEAQALARTAEVAVDEVRMLLPPTCGPL